MIELKRILYPTDFSTFSQSAQEYACEFAECFRAELHILHVLEHPVLLSPAPDTMFLIPPIDWNEMKSNAEKHLENLSKAVQKPGRTVVTAARTGAPLVEIVRYARDNTIDLIVLGTHGRTGLTHVLLGSVAENVIRKAPCPVLTIRPAGHQFVMP